MSAVTAVPIRPLARGSVLKLWLGAGPARAGRRGAGLGRHRAGCSASLTPPGVQYQVLREGRGELDHQRRRRRGPVIGRRSRLALVRRYAPRPAARGHHRQFPSRLRRGPEADAQGRALPLLVPPRCLARPGPAPHAPVRSGRDPDLRHRACSMSRRAWRRCSACRSCSGRCRALARRVGRACQVPAQCRNCRQGAPQTGPGGAPPPAAPPAGGR